MRNRIASGLPEHGVGTRSQRAPLADCSRRDRMGSVFHILKGAFLEKASRVPAIWIPLSYGIALLLLSPLHGLFSEWGGVMQYFAGKEILAGNGYHGWTSHFWPPLYSLLIGLGSLILPAFFAGKLISILGSALLLYVVYHLAMLLTNQANIGLWAQAFIALNPLYVYESLQAHNHILDSLFFVLGILLFLQLLEQPTVLRTLLAGLVCGVAGLSRYTSYVLIFMPLSLFVLFEFRKATRLSLSFWLGFAVISSPWWYYNAKYNGSPFYTWNYLNICAAAFRDSELGLSLHALWRCNGMANVTSTLDIFMTYPKEYIRNFVTNILNCLESITNGSLAIFVVPAMVESFLSIKPKYLLILFGEFCWSVILVSQAYVTPWYLLSWTVVMTIITVAFVLKYFEKLQEIYPTLVKYHFSKSCVVLLLLLSFFLTCRELRAYAREKHTYSPLWESEQVTKALKQHDSNIEDKVIMAIDPARAYYLGSKYLATPFEYGGTIDGLVSYRSLSERFKEYAPKHPASIPGSGLRADYFIYTNPKGIAQSRLHDLHQFSFLLDPNSQQIPKNFNVIYQSSDVIAYEIDWK